jgi:hypothetical protein
MKLLVTVFIAMFVACAYNINSPDSNQNALLKTGQISNSQIYMADDSVIVELSEDSLKFISPRKDRNNQINSFSHSLTYTANDSAILCYQENCQSIQIKFFNGGVQICDNDIGCFNYFIQ